MKVKFKKLTSHAQIPTYAKSGDAGMDLIAIDSYHNRDYNYIEYGTGLAVEIPEGYMGLVFPRSSISKTPHSFCNSVGLIDSGYRGEIMVRMRTKKGREDQEYNFGDKIGQLVILPYPKVEFEEVEELSNTERGQGGFGSTDG
jgi:dUTP pyrophosphatase